MVNTRLTAADRLYNKVKSLIQETKLLDEYTARLIVELADDAIELFADTNHEKKVELRRWKAQAELLLPPDPLDELRERAEALLLKISYPKKELLTSVKLLLSFLGYTLVLLAFIGLMYQSWQAPSPPPLQNSHKEDMTFRRLSFPSFEIEMHYKGTAKGAQLGDPGEIEVRWPKEMKTDSSDSITVVVYAYGGDSYIITKREGLETTSGKLDLSNLQIPEPHPENYEIYAVAKLAANNFNVIPNSEESQQIIRGKMSTLSWVWNISPKQAGQQIINLSIQAEIRDKTNGQKQTSKPVWVDELEINVNKPWLSNDQINITSIISCIIGAGLTIPWIYERVQERRKKKKTKNRSSTKVKH